MTYPHQRREPPRPRLELPKTSIWFKLWFAACALVGLGLLTLAVWAVITLVAWVTSQ